MKKIYIFGVGRRGRELLQLINRLEIAEVTAFIDNDIVKQNTVIEGKKCISLKDAIKSKAQKELIVVSPLSYKEIEEQLRNCGFENIFCWSKFFPNPAYCVPIIKVATDYQNAKPFNHYESPYPDIVEIHEKEEELFSKEKEILDIDFNISGQFELIKKMEKYDLLEWNSAGGGYRYDYNNGWFGKGSADALYFMIRIIKPKNIIEVGSGYSTAVMLDTNESYFDNKINIISIEPYADRLKSLLKPTDNLDILEKKIQDVPLNVFEILQENDILFIDSSHISRMNSDVNYIFFEILPRLKKGVYIHFHDIYYPFIYPSQLIYEGTVYSEMYLLRAFLMNNEEYSIQLFGGMLEEKYNNKIPDRLKGVGNGSFWVKKD